ncbi:MAG: Unknown protein [uncultured Sulfurovum sp.]|uniref:Uncharacterized protein n=1 Tax=uncultured Sulfurovum sp. TaxID=269237 RepID=A0A6S6SWN6_9BACT|nr:MAG: Unknown protein [uncultured Sulfurovum sp.]
MKLSNFAVASLTTLLLVGCGSSSSTSTSVDLTSSLDLPDEKTFIFFDNESSDQYLYNTTSDTNTDMNNDDNATYNMTGKTGKLIRWDHETAAGVDQKIVMLNYDFDINNGDLTYNDFQYLGHFHEEDNVNTFASHSNEEFDPEVSSDGKKAALVSLNTHLKEQEEVREEIAEALPSTEELCNFYVFEHAHEEESTTEEEHEEAAHIALTKSGKVYVYHEEEGEEALKQEGTAFALEGVSTCEEDRSSIVKASDYGVYIFSAESQTLYLVDSHGEDFHQHSKWTGSKFLPTNFSPTEFVGIGESDDEDDHDHD